MPGGNVDICRLDPPVDISVGKCRTRVRGTGRRHTRDPGGIFPLTLTLSPWVPGEGTRFPLFPAFSPPACGRGRGRARDGKGAPASPPAPPLSHYGKYGIGRVPGQGQFSFFRLFLPFPVFRPSLPCLARNKSTAVRLRWVGPGARRWYRRVSGPSAGSGHGSRPARSGRPFSPAVTPDLIRGPEPQAPPSLGFPRIGVRGKPGPRIKSGVTTGGWRRSRLSAQSPFRS